MALAGKVSLITGGGSGIGRAVALHFGRLGSKVVVSDINTTAGNETLSLLEAIGVQSYFFPCDVSDPSQIVTLFSDTVFKFGRIDIVCNNAGIAKTDEGFFTGGDFLKWKLIVDINLNAVVLGTQLAIQQMKNQPLPPGHVNQKISEL